MSLNLSKIQNVRTRGKKIVGRCPACAEIGHDKKGEHLVINEDGRFGCVVSSGNSPEARAHRKRIFELCGDRAIRPLKIRPKESLRRRGYKLLIKIQRPQRPQQGRQGLLISIKSSQPPKTNQVSQPHPSEAHAISTTPVPSVPREHTQCVQASEKGVRSVPSVRGRASISGWNERRFLPGCDPLGRPYKNPVIDMNWTRADEIQYQRMLRFVGLRIFNARTNGL